MSHALIVGGTGMLKDVTLFLLKKFDKVSVIARGENGFLELEKASGLYSYKINKIKTDYGDSNKLEEILIQSINSFGEISLAVSWVHSDAPEVSGIIGRIINNGKTLTDYYDIHGSSYLKPDGNNAEEFFGRLKNIIYHKIILGFVIERDNSRWLTNKEISNGVIKAIETESPYSIIGVIEPWSRKP